MYLNFKLLLYYNKNNHSIERNEMCEKAQMNIENVLLHVVFFACYLFIFIYNTSTVVVLLHV